MMFWYIVLFIVVVVPALTVAAVGVNFYATALTNGSGKRVKPSEPSRKIMKAFKTLPKENRPYPAKTLETALAALDLKNGRKKVTSHFTHRGWETSYFNWDECGNYRGTCWCREYKELKQAIEGIDRAVKEQSHAFEVAGIAHQLDRVKEITQALRDESDIVKSITHEVTNS